LWNISQRYKSLGISVGVIKSLNQLSALTRIPVQTLRDLNPQYRLDIIPGNERPYTLKIPLNYVNNYIDNETQIAQYKSDVYNPVKMVAPPTVSYNRAYYSATPPAGKNRIYHTVRTGETLGTIAELYKVRISDVKAWNRVRGTRIYAGQRLNIYTKSKKTTAQASNTSKDAENQLIKQNGYLCYEVKHGDTLWNISQRYKSLGISVGVIKSLNQLSDIRTLSSGQLLKIKKI
jgi:membrane-bound lytic murein transglycosylase D